MKKRFLGFTMVIVLIVVGFVGCDYEDMIGGSYVDTENTKIVADKLQGNQPTPTDIDYSLERYNHIRREYWVNGQREKANVLICSVEKPLGYVVLMTNSGSILGTFVVDGKVSSLQNYLTPISEYYEQDYNSDGSTNGSNEWLADTDGCYGDNPEGIFFFTIDGNYMEWTGDYLYSDIPFIIDEPVLKVGVVNE